MKKIVALLVALAMVASLAVAMASSPSPQEVFTIIGEGDYGIHIIRPVEDDLVGDDGTEAEIAKANKAGDPLAVLPAEIRAQLPAGFTAVNEVLQMQLDGNLENITKDLSVAIRFDTPYAAGSTVYLAVAIPADAGREWVLLKGVSNDDNNVEVTFDVETLQKIGDKIFTVMVISES